ncbi:hypothetical protein GCM10009827_101870 [Dactylosporangium maewongense]|uniref:ABC transporter domain-containing protein n=1 Tax=Dactylosporangium maewongense TaxID=634393 RepID=A0ABP4NPB1_9ACTN
MKHADHRKGYIRTITAVSIVGALGLLLSNYWLFLATSAAIAALISLSVGVVYGRAGMVALCPMAFAGIGGWTTGWLNLHTNLPFLADVVIGALAAVPVGIAMGLPALRLRGLNLAAATLAFGGAFAVVAFDRGFPGAAEHKPVERPIFASSETLYFFLAVLMLVVVSGLLNRAARTAIGASWMAVRDSERATAALGHSVVATKLLAFAVSAFIAGVGGALLAGQLGILSGNAFQPFTSMVIFTAAVAFGAAHLEGAILAGAATVFVPEILRLIELPQDIAPALFAVAALQALAGGEAGLAGALRAKWRPAPMAAAHPDRTYPVPSPALLAAVTRPRRVTDNSLRTPPLEVRDITVAYGRVVALDGVNLRVQSATVHGLIGPNGAGKSTLIDVISGFVSPTRGQIYLDGRVLFDVPPLSKDLPPHRRARKGIRRSFQQGRVSPSLTIDQYLRLSGARGSSDDRRLSDEILAALGCPAASTPIGTLDVGTRRLVGVATTLASRPSIVMLDEPAAGLATEESARLANVIRELPERFGCAVLLVEHDVKMIAVCCDEVTALDFGRVIAHGTPRSVLRNPKVLRAYLGGVDQPSRRPAAEVN